jgi:hypothetical protein
MIIDLHIYMAMNYCKRNILSLLGFSMKEKRNSEDQSKEGNDK